MRTSMLTLFAGAAAFAADAARNTHETQSTVPVLQDAAGKATNCAAR